MAAAVLGAFITTDSILTPNDPQDLNAYSYAKGNPATYSDPTGKHYVEGPGGGSCDTSTGAGCAYINSTDNCYSDNKTQFNNCVANYNKAHARGGSQPGH